ncbi:MAG: YihA family ribosome biosis GTP-binding protein [Bacteroidetes bacterium]|jgi:GTP-binding protein|nr:YihA family ribosome biosis GTP-binding protein [Bacteroidota bacterium]
MVISKATFVKSSKELKQLPKPDKPEYAFIGRSNVGKSSLINMVCNNNKLAQTSGKPGKTKLINHFLINESWYLVDLPGFGYASTSKVNREAFEGMISDYITKRKSLICLFLLIDSRLEMQKIDAEFMDWLAEKEIAFVIAFTKTDKLGKNELAKNMAAYKKELVKHFGELPDLFLTSAEKGLGKAEILAFINENMHYFTPPPKSEAQ